MDPERFIIHGECDCETQKGNRKRKMFESLVMGEVRTAGWAQGNSLSQSLHFKVKETGLGGVCLSLPSLGS